jgi:hypothetical protein
MLAATAVNDFRSRVLRALAQLNRNVRSASKETMDHVTEIPPTSRW